MYTELDSKKTKTIDFEALNKKITKKQGGPLSSLLLAVTVTFALLAILGLVALLTNNDNRASAAGAASVLFCLVFFAILIKVAISYFRTLHIEKKLMQAFARSNDWKFDGQRQGVDAKLDELFENTQFVKSETLQRYVIHGNNFSLFGLYLAKKPSNKEILVRTVLKKTGSIRSGSNTVHGQAIVLQTKNPIKEIVDKNENIFQYTAQHSNTHFFVTPQLQNKQHIETLFKRACLL